MRPKIVMKFGGTSVGSAEAFQKVADLIQASLRRRPLVVLSAVGRVTDLLEKAASTAYRGGDWEEYLKEIVDIHRQICSQLEISDEDVGQLEEKLFRWLQGVYLLRELTPRVYDALLSLGERISTRILAQLLRKRGIKAQAWKSWELGLLTDNKHNRASILQNSYQAIERAVEELDGGVVPVVTGFIGRSIDGEITTLGRGGSDFSAAIFGAALRVEEIQIWTDVPGFLRADPRFIDGSELIPEMTFDEAFELAYFGAKVLHPRTIEPAQKAGIPVRVVGTFHVTPSQVEAGEIPGTLIHSGAPPEALRALAIREEVTALQIRSTKMLEAPGFLAKIFSIFAEKEISVDVVTTSEVSVSVTFDQYSGKNLEEAIAEISQFADVSGPYTRSLICAVGSDLGKNGRLITQIFDLLSRGEIPIYLISQGASRLNVTIITDRKFARSALELLHSELIQKANR